MTPSQALHRIVPSILLPYIAQDSLVEYVDLLLRDKESIMQLLKHSLTKVQHRM